MALPPLVIKYLRMKAERDVTTPAGATYLANDIAARTGEVLAANTIKRLVGILPYEGKPRTTTLNILAQYLGWSSWESYETYIKRGSSSFDASYPFCDICTLPHGAKISFKWHPDRSIVLRHVMTSQCEVVKVENSKLQAGDTLILSQLGNGFPFYVKSVIRDGVNLGTYAAAIEEGIYDLTIEQP